MASIRIKFFAVILTICFISSGLGCRAPSRPFVSSSGAISTCRQDGDCPTSHECRLLWLGFKVCCSLPFSPTDKSFTNSPHGEAEVSEVESANRNLLQGDPNDVVRYYYVYVAARTPSPAAGSEKSWNPDLALTFDKTSEALDLKQADVAAVNVHSQQQLQTGKGTPTYPASSNAYSAAYTSDTSPPAAPYYYAPISTSAFDIYALGADQGAVQQPPYPHSRSSFPTLVSPGQVPPVASFLGPYRYGAYSYRRPTVSKTD